MENRIQGLDEVLLHHVAEQKCKKFGCRYVNCLKTKQQSECMPLFRALQMCKADEMKRIEEIYKKTGVQEK
ncbi:UNKNOWN [Stylonychia lemnae]|uniref:Uncharacterized protein n=1 Tax=Stylonychia lemnae TaxID=5949 RepID=A0A077ZQD6_STYLE|nr:UNKNOWN [Stylonychia lemnae]|eukprot:CDW72123.1 UNKNOWN [Stylonychia lemnae]